MVFVTNFDRIFALSRVTGRPIWSVQINAIPSSSTAADEERVMVGLHNGRLEAFYCLESKKLVSPRESTTPNFSNADVPEHRAGQIAWNWQSNAKITARPIVAGRVVVFASQDGKVYVTMANAQVMLGRFVTGGPIIGSLGTHGARTLLVPSEDQNLYAIDLFTTEMKWTFPSGARSSRSPWSPATMSTWSTPPAT